MFTEWDSEFEGVSVSLRSLHRDGWTVTAYGKTSIYDGSEGELYDLKNDPRQWRNLWDEPSAAAMKKDLLAEVWQLAWGGSDRTVDVHLSWLRRKLGETAREPRYLHSVRGVGVRLTAPSPDAAPVPPST